MAATGDTLIIFDAGGVLVQNDYGVLYDAWAKLSGRHTAAEIKALFAKSGLEKETCLGNISNKEFTGLVRKEVLNNPSVTDKEIINSYLAVVPRQIDGTVRLKRKLIGAGHKVGILSTTSGMRFESIKMRFPEVWDVSDPGLIELSYVSHVSKPDAAAYRRFIGKAKMIIFIEDKASYLQTALDLGWHAIHFVAFPDPNEAMQAFAGSKNPYVRLEHPNYHRAESVAEVERVLAKLGVAF